LRADAARARLVLVPARRWTELTTMQRRAVLSAGVAEGALKIAALIDLRRRPAGQIRGSKRSWAVAITLVNSLGAVPIAYFLRGRRRSTV
jgi:hypothetical protein